MPVFFQIEDLNDKLEVRLKALIEIKYGALFNHQSFIKTFNRDIDILEKLIVFPPQESYLKDVVYLKQEEHNHILKEGEMRWRNSGRSVDVGAKAIHDLSLKTKDFVYAKKMLDNFVNKKIIINKFSTKNGPWLKFEGLINLLPDEQQEAAQCNLSFLKKKWKMQGELAVFDSNDIMILDEELKKIKELLDFILDVIPVSSENELDQALVSAFNKNKEVLCLLEAKKIAVMAWKIKAASKKRCMWSNDSFSALCFDLASIFESLSESDLSDVDNYFKVSREHYSRAFSPDLFCLFLDEVEKTADWHGLASQCYWGDECELFAIPIKMLEHYAVPKKLSEYIPNEVGWTPDSRVRFQYFRESTQTVMKLNECFHEMQLLHEGIAVAKSLKLEYLTDTPGFKSALYIKDLINKEREKALYYKPSWGMGLLLRNELYGFITEWLDILNKVEVDAYHAASEIAHVLMNRLGGELLKVIREKTNLLPGNMVKDLCQFVKIYGSKEDNDILIKILDPLEMFNRFVFLKPKKEGYKREIDMECTAMFLGFSEKYWSATEYDAIKLLISIVRGDWYPAVLEDECYLAKTLAPILPAVNRGQHFKALMENVAQKYIDKTADRSSESAYYFLKRYSSETAGRWRKDRQENIDQKYLLINHLFSIQPNEENNLSSEDALKKSQDGLVKSQCVQYIHDLHHQSMLQKSNYLGPLLKKAKSYVLEYQGENPYYAELISELALLSSQSDLFKEYFEKRMNYLVRQFKCTRELTVTQLDCVLFANINFADIVNNSFIIAIDELENCLESSVLFDWVENVGAPSVKEHYRIKRLEYLLEENDLNKTEKYSESLLDVLRKGESGVLIKTPLGQQKLQSVYSDFLKKMTTLHTWQANAVVIMDAFSTHLKSQNVEYLNYLWFREYFLYPERFDPDGEFQRPDLDYNFHSGYIQIPDDEMSLTKFYGDNLNYVKLLIFEFMKNFTLDDVKSQLSLIDVYLESSEFKNDSDSFILHKMCGIIRRATEIYYDIKSKDYISMRKKVLDFISDYEAAIDLADIDPSVERLAEIAFFDKIQTELMCLKYFKHTNNDIVWYRRRESNSHEVAFTKF